MSKTTPKAGDQVLYTPSVDHALDKDASGKYAWVHGWQKHPKSPVVEADNAHLVTLIDLIRRRPDDRKKLVPIHPAVSWDAVIRNVNSDGSADLDIDYCLPGVVHSYDRVPRDDTGTKGGTWRPQQ